MNRTKSKKLKRSINHFISDLTREDGNMVRARDKAKDDGSGRGDDNLPLAIQIFLWRQTR